MDGVPLTLRLPMGGYLAAATAAIASSLLTIGTTIPWAPLSSTRLMWSWREVGRHAARAEQPASAIEANIRAAVSNPTRLCSMSTVNQAKPLRARKRAALPSESSKRPLRKDAPAFERLFDWIGSHDESSVAKSGQERTSRAALGFRQPLQSPGVRGASRVRPPDKAPG